MIVKRFFIILLILSIALFTFSGCTVVLLALGASYLLGEPTEPTEPAEPEVTGPEPTNFCPAFKSRAYLYRS